MLENYYKSFKERADLGIPPLPLNAEQTTELVELIKKETMIIKNSWIFW